MSTLVKSPSEPVKFGWKVKIYVIFLLYLLCEYPIDSSSTLKCSSDTDLVDIDFQSNSIHNRPAYWSELRKFLDWFEQIIISSDFMMLIEITTNISRFNSAFIITIA